jgi:SAM-dependent methyltransferase
MAKLETTPRDLDKAALRGEPSYVWRDGQQRRLQMILDAAGERVRGSVLEDGCGVGMYMKHLQPLSGRLVGLDYDRERTRDTRALGLDVVNAAGEHLPFPSNTFDLIFSNEVIEHVADDRLAVAEMVRTLKTGGRLVVFCPNAGYPVETHGIYWRGKYHFGNIPLVNYLPSRLRNRLAPHVRVYSRASLQKLFIGLPVRVIQRGIIFGGYDNIIARLGRPGKILRSFLQFLERTPLRWFGLSHFWIIEKI